MNEFWKTKRMEGLNPQEWESLCDGCSQCCLYKLQEDQDGNVRFTNVVCRYMDMDTCACTDYIHRHQNVPDCIYLTPKLAREVDWLPKTCAYYLVAHGQDLPWWHPLKTGDPDSTKRAGASVYGKVVGETDVDPEDLEDMVVDWFK
jgi:uncharacterized cysteine cluster protein YcgN (CxxCxxCC family)